VDIDSKQADDTPVVVRSATAIVPPNVDVTGVGRFGFGFLITALYIFLLAPILIVVFTSFSPGMSNTYALSQASLHWYREFLANSSFVSSFKFSLLLALLASFFATIIGLLTSYAIVRFLGRARTIGQSIAMLPMMMPHILISLSLLLLLTRLPLPEMSVLVIGHVLICLPFTIAGITASLEGVDPDIEAAAYTLGANRLRVLWEVTIPLVAPGVLSAAIFAFIISFGDVYIALFISGPGATTLPVEIFSYVQWESSPVVAAITTIQIVMIILFGLFIERLVGLRSVMRI
jgi:putative spermidine/putrescine transport system permease protein